MTAQPTHSDLARDFGQMEGRMDSLQREVGEVKVAMTAFLARGEALLSHKWELDDAVDAAANTQAVAAIDVGAGWP